MFILILVDIVWHCSGFSIGLSSHLFVEERGWGCYRFLKNFAPYPPLSFFLRMECLLSLQRYDECLAMINHELVTDESNPTLYVLRAQINILFGNVSPSSTLHLSSLTPLLSPSPFFASSLLLYFPLPPPPFPSLHTPTDHPGILWCVQCSTDWSSAQRRFRDKEKTPERCSGLQKSGQNVNVTHTQTLLHTFSPHPPPTGSTPQFSWEEDGGTEEDHSCHWNRPSCPRVPYVQVNSISSFYHCKRRLVDALSMLNIYTLTSQLEYVVSHWLWCTRPPSEQYFTSHTSGQLHILNMGGEI